MPRTRNSTPIPIRVSTLNNTRKHNPAPIGVDRPSALKLYDRFGFEWLPSGKPILDIDDIADIADKYKILTNNRFKLPMHDLLLLESVIAKKIKELGDLYSDLNITTVSRGDAGSKNSAVPEKDQEGQWIICADDINVNFGGCNFYVEMTTESANPDIMETGLFLQSEFLGVYEWHELDLDSYTDWAKEMACNDDDEDSPAVDYEDWHKSERSICTYNGYSIPIKNIAEALKEQDEDERKKRQKRYDMLISGDFMEKLEEMLSRKTNAALWLKGIIYLMMNDFHLSNYSIDAVSPAVVERDSEHVALERQYATYHKYDDYFLFIDNWDESADVAVPATFLMLNERCKVYPNPKRDYHRMFEIFNYLFSYMHKDDKFHEDEKHAIQTSLNDLDIQQWKSVLRRRIKRAERRRMGLH